MATDQDVLDEAIDIANDVEKLCQGKRTAAVYIALAKVIGASAADAERPDLCGLMDLLNGLAHVEMARRLDERAIKAAH